MQTVRIEATIEADGELHLTQLPCRRGDRVEATVLILDSPTPAAVQAEKDEAECKRQKALEHFLELARTSKFRSEGPYPTRDELHERR